MQISTPFNLTTYIFYRASMPYFSDRFLDYEASLHCGPGDLTTVIKSVKDCRLLGCWQIVPMVGEKSLGIIGFGNQARVWAENLRDSHWEITIWLRPGSKSIDPVVLAGFHLETSEQALSSFEAVALLIPDEQAPLFLHRYGDFLLNKRLIFAHGYNVHFNCIEAIGRFVPLLVAPKAIAAALRENYCNGYGVYGLIGALRDLDRHRPFLLSLAKDLGFHRGIIESDFAEETISDLYSEQVVLCGGIPGLIREAFEKLVAQGFNPQIAFFECVKEAKLIVDIIDRYGFSGMYDRISPTAAFGGLTAIDRLFDDSMKEKLDGLYTEIIDGNFHRRFKKEIDEGYIQSRELKKCWADHRIEAVFAELEGRDEKT